MQIVKMDRFCSSISKIPVILIYYSFCRMKSFVHLPQVFDYLQHYSAKSGTSSHEEVLLQVEDEMNQLVFEIVDQQGLPLVIKNLHHHPLWNRTDKSGSCALLSFDFLEQFHGNRGIFVATIIDFCRNFIA